MASNGASELSSAAPIRPKHHYSRSMSDIVVPTVAKPQHHHQHRLHYHPHRIHRKHHSSSLSPLLGPQLGSTQGGWTSEVVSPIGSRNGSRRESLDAELSNMLPSPWQKRAVQEGEVKHEKEKGVLQVKELRDALAGLNSMANETTRRLDSTYYSVLEKMSVLQGTILVLKELSASMKQVNEDFETETGNFVQDVTTQLDGFHNFGEQEKTIENLQARVVNGRETVKSLGDRVTAVKERIESWEKSNLGWQEKTRKRLKVYWIIMLICGAVFIALVLFQYTPAGAHTSGVIEAWNASALAEKIPTMEEFLNETWSLARPQKQKTHLSEKEDASEVELEDDPRLKLFDEL